MIIGISPALQNWMAVETVRFLHRVAELDTQIVLLVVLVVIAVIVLDAVACYSSAKRHASGIAKRTAALGIDGSKTIPTRDYVSRLQNLSGRPDALLLENGYVIPVECKPLARKIRDRYVAQLLVYMRLVEEFEQQKPPYGYLILGPNCRRVKIDNTVQRQAWLQELLDQLRAVLHGAPAQALPETHKCRQCDVRGQCAPQKELLCHGQA